MNNPNYPSLFDSFFGDSVFDSLINNPAIRSARRLPNMETDIVSDAGTVTIKVNLPGIAKKNVSVDLDEGVLTVSATAEETEKDVSKYVHHERYVGTVKRSYYIGEDVARKDVKATMDDGVLTISFPKKTEEEMAKERRIDIG